MTDAERKNKFKFIINNQCQQVSKMRHRLYIKYILYFCYHSSQRLSIAQDNIDDLRYSDLRGTCLTIITIMHQHKFKETFIFN